MLLLVAGCTAAPPPEPRPAEPASAKEAVTAKPHETPRRAVTAVTEKYRPGPKPQTTAVPPQRKARINDNPNQLLQFDGQRVATLLGPANFIRRDGSAEVWQYRAAACVLDVYLYKEAGGLKVAHVDLRKRERATLAPRRCFRYILTRPK